MKIIDVPLKGQNQRLQWVDTAKAIGIFIVIMGHHRHVLYEYIYSFHMPLFFFISGYLFKPEKFPSLKDVVVSRSVSLLVPYFTFAILLYLFWLLLGAVKPSTLEGFSLTKNALGIVYAQGQLEYMSWGTEMWFLPCLFLLTIGYFCIDSLTRTLRVTLLILFALIAQVYVYYWDYRLPWSIDIGLSVMIFFGLGNILKPYIDDLRVSIGLFLFLASMFAGNIIFYSLNSGRVDIYLGIFQNPILFYLSALCGVLFYFLVCKFIPSFRFLSFIGANSIIIYMLHMRAYTVINFSADKIFNIQLVEGGLGQALIVSCVQVLVLIPVILFINRYLPVLVGRPKRLSSD